jgi:hypothetical protein
MVAVAALVLHRKFVVRQIVHASMILISTRRRSVVRRSAGQDRERLKKASAGVARQCSGIAGRIENCQIGVLLT